MDLDELLAQINVDRTADIVLTMNSGTILTLPPGTKAYIQGVDTLLIIWPGESEYRVSQSRWVSGVNVATAHSQPTAA